MESTIDKLSTCMGLLRNISSAARLVSHYTSHDSTYNPPGENVEKYVRAIERLDGIEADSHKIARLLLEVQKEINN